MVDDPHNNAISPHIRALSLYIENAVQRLQNAPADGAGTDQGNLIFFGNWQDPYPRLLVTDPVLEPVDKIVWQIIRIHITQPGSVAAFPSYEALCKGANVRSNHTVSRALAILRATRWLSLCARVRDTQGRYLGNVYALHDEPVTLGDAMFLDSDYMAFLDNSIDHSHSRVRKVIASVLETIQDSINTGQDIISDRIQTRSYVRRLEVLNQSGEMQHLPLDLSGPTHFYAVSTSHIERLNLPDPQVQNTHTDEFQNSDHVQTMHMAGKDDPTRVQNPHSDVHSSSNYINTTTTCSTPPESKSGPQADLYFPPNISPNEKNLALMYLKSIDTALRQDVLDEWHGRMRSSINKGRPIENPIGYLAVLCQRIKTHEFNLTIGLRIREVRQREQRQAEEARNRDRQFTDTLRHQAIDDDSRIGKRLKQIQDRAINREKERDE